MRTSSKGWPLLVANLSPEEYEGYGPAFQQAGLALAELRQVQRDTRGTREIYERALLDLDRAEERARNAMRLLEEAE